MALPPTHLYILCTGSSENIYMKLKINKCLSVYGLNNKNKFILVLNDFDKNLQKEQQKKKNGIEPIQKGPSDFDNKIRFLINMCSDYLNEYADYLDSLGYSGYEVFDICENCKKLYLKEESSCPFCKDQTLLKKWFR